MSGKIHKAIIEVMGKVGAIGKSRKNEQQGFMYRSVEEIYSRLQPLMAQAGIYSVPEVIDPISCEQGETKRGGANFHILFRVQYTFFAEDGSSVKVVTAGESIDTGDKGCNKAMAFAHKYALMQIFNIPYQDMDPDQFAPEWSKEPGAITFKELEAIKKDWWMNFKDGLKDKSPEEREEAFGVWVHEATGEDIAASDFKQWRQFMLEACREDLLKRGAEILAYSGL